MTPAYTTRIMTRDEIDLAVDWAAAEGWKPGLRDAESFYAADPEGFRIGLLRGEPVAVLSTVKYGTSFGFLGFYIVKPEHRGKGYGIRLWNDGLQSLAGRGIGLDGVVEWQDKYQASGFTLAHRNIRYQGTGVNRTGDDPDVTPLSALSFDAVHAYDRAFFPEDRARFLKAWINQPEGVALGFRRGDSLAGYGVIRPCRSGFKVGPLFADAPEIAERLLAALAGRAPEGAPITLDLPETNAAAIGMAERNGMKVVFETARMYTGPHPNLPLGRTFGITTFELG